MPRRLRVPAALVLLAVPHLALAQSYFPPPESQGGWRTTNDPAVVASLGVDPGGLTALGDATMAVSSFDGPTGFLVIKNGYVVAERYSSSSGRAYLYRLASNGKSVAMLAFGRIVEAGREGRLPYAVGLDSPVYDARWLPEGFPLSDPRKARITFHHIFRHLSGIVPEAKGDVRGGTGWDFLDYTVGKDAEYPNSASLYFEPGTPQCPYGDLALTTGYSSVAFNHLTFVIPRLTGMTAGQYLRRNLLDAIGAGAVTIDRVQGHEWPTSGGLYMSARDYARVAYLILKQGAWDGRQVVPEAWLSRFATSPDYLNVRSNVDAYFGAGYPRDLVRIFGSGLNWAFVVPSLDLLAIRVGRATNSQFKAVQADFLRRLFAAVTGPYARPAGPFVKRLTLIDADTDRPVAGFDPLPCGARLDLGTLPTPRLNIRADTSPATVGSVGFRLDGTTVRLENGAPYALAGDDGGGDYYPWTPGGGLHVVSVTPYSGARGGGTAGPPLTVTFTVK